MCDFDTVSESNLNRQFLYTAEEIGKEKVFLAQKKLSALSPSTKLSAFSKKIESTDDLSFALHTDILFLAVDNNTARSAVQSFCKTNRIPLVNGGVNGFFGTAYLYVPGKTADLSAAGLLTHENTASYSVTSTVGIIGALEAHLGIRYLINDTEDSGYLFVFDGGTVTRLPIKYSEILQNVPIPFFHGRMKTANAHLAARLWRLIFSCIISVRE